jgi:hypothetical protein
LIFPFRGKTPQIYFQTLVDNFSLTISLGMIDSVEMQLGALWPEHLLPNIAGESGISIRNNRMRHAMKLEDMIHEYLSHSGCGKWVLNNT